MVSIALSVLLSFSGHAAPSLWFSDTVTLYQADLAGYTLTRSLSMEVDALVTDSKGGAWVVTSTELIRFSSDGMRQLVITRESLDLKGKPVLAVDPWDDSLWLGTEKNLLHINATGEILQKLTLLGHDSDPVVIEVGMDQSIWYLTQKSLKHYSSTGAILVEVPLKSLLEGHVRHMVLDPLNPIIWISADNEDDHETESKKYDASYSHTLLKLDFSGMNMTSLSVATPNLRDIAFNSQNGDPQNGILWALSDHKLFRYRADGTLDVSIDLRALNLSSVSGLTLSTGSENLWISHRSGVTALSKDGSLLASLATDKKINYADATLLHVAPTLSLMSPPVSLLSNNTMPIYILSYGADCNGLPCNLSSRQWAGYRLGASLNDLSIDERFTFNAATGQTAWTPTTPLAEGIYRFSAQAHDANGHTTNTVASTIAIDTTPPRFFGPASAKR